MGKLLALAALATPAHSKVRPRRWLTELVVQSGFAKLWIFRLAGGDERTVDGGQRFAGALPLRRALNDGANAIDLKSQPFGDGALLETGVLAGLPDLHARCPVRGPRRRARWQADRQDRRQGKPDTNCLRSTAHRRVPLGLSYEGKRRLTRWLGAGLFRIRVINARHCK